MSVESIVTNNREAIRKTIDSLEREAEEAEARAEWERAAWMRNTAATLEARLAGTPVRN